MASETGQTGKGKFPATIIFMTTVEENEAIRDEAASREITISQVVRELVADGRKRRAKKADS